MERVHDRELAWSIAEAMRYLPPRFQAFAQAADCLLGVDPLFVGLHGDEDASDGRSYRTTAHVAYPWHTTDKSCTVVMPPSEGASVHVAIHELAHVIHWQLKERTGQWIKLPTICEYAERNDYEAFACALHSWTLEPAFAAEDMNEWGGHNPESRATLDVLAFN